MLRFSRFISFAVSALIGAQLLPAFAFAAFTDVKASTQYGTAIQALESKGIVKGYANGEFKPTARINRAEFAKIVAEMSGDPNNMLEQCKSANAREEFPDVKKTDWFFPYVCALRNQNIIQGYDDGFFRPGNEVTFPESAKMISLSFQQEMADTGGEWYEKYVLALESAKAIPQSIAKLDVQITRGEMAEMMWRLSEGKTDLPSKGLANLRHPSLSINLASDSVQYAKSCAELQTFASAAQTSGMRNMYDGRGGEVMMEMDGAAAPAANKSTDYSRTNVQVEGVDEADIIKTDGAYLYIISNREKQIVRIVKASPGTSMSQVATIDLTSSMMPSELYVEDGKLIVIGQRAYNWDKPMPMLQDGSAAKMMIAPDIWPGPYTQRTDVRIYNVSNPASPVLDRTVSFDGHSVSTRRIGDKLYLVLQQPFNYYGGPVPLPAVKLPQVEDSRTGKTVDAAPCDRIAILPHIPSPEYMTVAVIPTNDKNKEVKTTVVLGSAQNIYASTQNLYVAAPQWNEVWDSAMSEAREKTRVYRFMFTDAGVELKAQGDVPGHILNQFSMDENTSTSLGTHFRIATTINQEWETKKPSANNLYVLNMNMEQAGAVTDIAPGETIYSVRFVGDRAYMVTFKTVDPFFVIDLSDPRDPQVLGALKIPGFSNYLHPYDENHVIGFGKDVDESIDADKVHSTDAIYYTAVQGLKIALFDVTDVKNPKQKAVEVIGDRGTDSPLLSNHKALLFEKDRGLLAFPVMVTKRPAGSPKSAEANTVFQGAYVYDISLNGFKLRGTITHYDDTDAFIKSGQYWYGGTTDIQRIIRIGKQLVTISDGQVRSHNETSVTQEGRVELK